MQVRKITEKDNYDNISTIYARSWKTVYNGIIPKEYLDSIVDTQWSKHLASHNYINLVLLDENKYIGTASVCSARDKKMQGWGEIVSIYLLPDYIGKGCGKLLLDCAIMTLKNMGCN